MCPGCFNTQAVHRLEFRNGRKSKVKSATIYYTTTILPFQASSSCSVENDLSLTNGRKMLKVLDLPIHMDFISKR